MKFRDLSLMRILASNNLTHIILIISEIIGAIKSIEEILLTKEAGAYSPFSPLVKKGSGLSRKTDRKKYLKI